MMKLDSTCKEWSQQEQTDASLSCVNRNQVTIDVEAITNNPRILEAERICARRIKITTYLICALLLLTPIILASARLEQDQGKGQPQPETTPDKSLSISSPKTSATLEANSKSQQFAPLVTCRASYFASGDNSSLARSTLQFNYYTLPYPELTLVAQLDEPAPVSHFSELVTYLSSLTLTKAVFIASSSPYITLLVAAATPPSVIVRISSRCSHIDLIRKNMQLNHLLSKVVFQTTEKPPKDAYELVITDSTQVILKYQGDQVLLVYESPGLVRHAGIYRLQSQEFCGPLSARRVSEQLLPAGLYTIPATP